MSYQVAAVQGDTLCSIAQREGFSNCGTLRSELANAPFLNAVLAAGDMITIPQSRDGWYFTKVATARRWTVRWAKPKPLPQPKELRFVRTTSANPTAGDAIASLRISRFHPRLLSGDRDVGDWPDHTQRQYVAAATDPAGFNLEVIDPDRPNDDVAVLLEALRPNYNHGAPTRTHQRFPAGAVRDARTLSVTLSPWARPAGIRHRSCYLRLVVDDADKSVRPQQALLCTTMVDDGDEEVEILDQNVRARYEDPGCPRDAGERCAYAVAEIPLVRGREIALDVRILRAAPTGLVERVATGPGDDGVAQIADVRRHILRNVRQIYAQEEVVPRIHDLRTVDPPSSMLTVANADAALASGQRPDHGGAGVFGFRLALHAPATAPAVHHIVAAVTIQANETPAQTAARLAQAVNNLNVAGLAAVAVANATAASQARPSADVMLTLAGGRVVVDQDTAPNLQDEHQLVEVVNVDPAAFSIRSTADDIHIGGPMQRCLFRSANITSTRVNVFVIDRYDRTLYGHSIGAQAYLPGQYQSPADIRNCLTVVAEVVSANLDYKPATLAHEIGHLVADSCGHMHDDAGEGSVMTSMTDDGFNGGIAETRRIFASVLTYREVVTNNQHAPMFMAAHGGPLGIATVTYDMSLRIRNNATVAQPARPP